MPLKRKLTRSNAHFKQAADRLPLGISSSFRYWGEDETIVEPDSREPWFMCAAHDAACLDDTLHRFENALDRALSGS